MLPREVFDVPVSAAGHLYIMPCPHGRTTIDDLAAQGIDVIISLLERQEASALSLGQEHMYCEEAGMEFRVFPIADFSLPEREIFLLFISGICADLKAGKSVAVHCRAGIGRSGMTVSGVLMQFGATAQQAIDQVSIARGKKVPDTQAQQQFIKSLE